MDESRRRQSRYVAVIRALALVGGASAAGCGSGTYPPDVPGYQVKASALGGYCVCCPTGDWSGQCYSGPLPPLDGGMGSPQSPPTGQRWCASADLIADGAISNPSCPIAGPLLPPDLPIA